MLESIGKYIGEHSSGVYITCLIIMALLIIVVNIPDWLKKRKK